MKIFSKIQLMHHQEQVDAARAEFMDWWPIYLSLRKKFKTKAEMMHVQTILWRAFLRKKGLVE